MTIAGGGRVCFYRAGEGSLKGRFSIPALCNSSLPFFLPLGWQGCRAGQFPFSMFPRINESFFGKAWISGTDVDVRFPSLCFSDSSDKKYRRKPTAHYLHIYREHNERGKLQIVLFEVSRTDLFHH